LFGAALAAGAQAIIAQPASADVIWRDGQPVFRSDRPTRSQSYYGRERYMDRGYQDYQQPEPEPPASGQYPALASGGPRPAIAPEAPGIISLAKKERPGTIVIDTANRRLYYMISSDTAYSYPISVGRDGFRWTGTHKVTRVQSWPSWHPPEEMRKRQPGLPIKMEGGLRNPLGAKALYLGSTLYRIHGTNDPSTIGRAASSGCFRMMNEHVLHLASLADVGTEVRVLKRYDGAAGPTVSQLDTRQSRR